ncbi:response regulator transcription factor [Pseudoduganella lutea]|uniref:Response regulator transcription factor n=1 Tax=Pseudoduganella lutea TaxID=321985 RepID=A0A4P6L489_9BURK|nr:response regulator transcription factor [Pseudoduganella lutea]QBE66379.1 response regulator transcription factor [Pseudoduganella lutea]
MTMIYITHKEATVKAGISAMLAANCDLPLVSLDQSQLSCSVRGTLITDYDHGMQTAEECRARCEPGLKIIVVTNRTREWDIRNAIDGGIHGILTQDCDAGELAEAILHLQSETLFLSRCITGRARAAMRREKLTSRELQVLRSLGKGLCNKSIARALGIAEVTVKIHLGNLMMKLGASTRTQAIVIANVLGLLEFDLEMVNGTHDRSDRWMTSRKEAAGGNTRTTGYFDDISSLA